MAKKIQPQTSKSLFGKYTSLIVWIIGIVAVLGLLSWLINANTISLKDMPVLTPLAVASTDHVLGSGKTLIIEYSDFECPACASYQTLIEQFLEEHGENVTFVYRHFPLKNIHDNAVIAAKAAEAAGKQGKFFEMSSLLFANQKDWANLPNPKVYFLTLATNLELDAKQFEKDMASKEIAAKVENDFQSAMKLALRGTPSFFVNGRQVSFASVDELARKI